MEEKGIVSNRIVERQTYKKHFKTASLNYMLALKQKKKKNHKEKNPQKTKQKKKKHQKKTQTKNNPQKPISKPTNPNQQFQIQKFLLIKKKKRLSES